jgi:hypothetical protein
MLEDDVNHVKGIAFLGMIEAFRRLKGEGAGERLLASLSPELRDLLGRGLLTDSGWYPIRWYRGLLASMQKVAAGGHEVVWEASRAAAANDLSSGAYKYIVKVLTPEWLVQRGVTLFQSYYKKGEALCTIVGPRHGVVVFEGCVGFDRAMWEDLLGGCAGIFEAAGAKDVHELSRKGGGDGDERIEVNFSWSE